jgi:hypothetical protein
MAIEFVRTAHIDPFFGVVQKQAILGNKGKGNPSTRRGRFSVFCEENGKGELPAPV